MIKNRLHHWSCSKFADLIRGIKKPYALELGKWSEWKKEQKRIRPWRFWLSDTVLPKVQNIIYFPYDAYSTVKTYVRNRYFDKIHYLKTGLKPGEYYDLDTRILYALFNELVDFVEIELAHLSKWDTNKKYKFKNGRCIEAAYDYFNWVENNFEKTKKTIAQESKTSSFYSYHMDMYYAATNDVNRSRQIKRLYEWWKNERPNRVSPYSDPELGDIDDIFSDKNREKRKELYEKTHQIQLEQEEEDTKMLIELISVRKSLWT
jgi:hypothetical protein